ncbi:MAG: chromate efflux transporter [Pseudomonadota bacterium]|nr:chromate efflux transporter [Pseudomonadota bacterium]
MSSLEGKMSDNRNTKAAPSFGEAFGVWLKIGLLSFGGPAGQIALMHKVLVEERHWIDESRFLHALNYCMLLPGPEAQQLATYIGWLLNRTVGGLVAGLLFVLPGAFVILALSIAYALYAQIPLVAAAFIGVKAAVLIVVVEALLRIGKRALKTAPMYLIAVAGFVAIFLFAVPFPIIIAGAALIGLIGGMTRPDLFVVIKGQSADGAVAESVVDAMAARGELSHTKPSAARSVLLIAVFGVLWGGPVAVLFIILGGENVFAQEAACFSKLAVVTFGGAYAVLAYMAQQAVETYGWLTGTEMLDGLGLAETTPGPLIMVTQFVGFLGAYRHAVGIDPILAGVIGSVVTVWVTFAPCFLWIFLGAPYIERLRDNLHLSAALSGITAAVVGVIMNLAVWFGLRVAFAEVGSMEVAGISLPTMAAESANLTAIGMTIVAGIVMFRLHWDVLRTLALCGGGAILIHLMI